MSERADRCRQVAALVEKQAKCSCRAIKIILNLDADPPRLRAKVGDLNKGFGLVWLLPEFHSDEDVILGAMHFWGRITRDIARRIDA